MTPLEPPGAGQAMGETVMLRSEWLTGLRDAAGEVFSMMLGAAVDPVPNPDDCPVLARVTGVVGITGAVNAIFTLRCSDAAATRLAAQMLGLSAEESAAQKFDALGEVCNMVAGNFKHKIGHGPTCMLTVPTVVMGGNYCIHSLASQRMECPVMYEGEPLWLALDIRDR
jgi:chemotaxis protein CheX